MFAAAPAPDAASSSHSAAGGRFELFVLGVAQDGGVPHLGCDKECCVTARRLGWRRSPASLGIHDRESGALLLIEATPDIEGQVARLQELAGASGRGRRPVDAILLTHAHIGHYLGLAQLGREVAATSGLPVFVSPRLASFLRDNGPWSQLVELGQVTLNEIQPGVPFEPIAGLKVTALQVPHRDEFSDTMAFRLQGRDGTIVFCPDVDAWDRRPGLLDSLLAGAAAAYLDATFYDGRELPGRNLKEIPHPLMTDTMQRTAGRVAVRPGLVRFIHLNHTNPALWDSTLQREIEGRGFRLAREGERLSF